MMKHFSNPKTVPDTELLDEPSLEELLADPIILLIMKRDGVKPNYMRGEINRLQREFSFAGAMT